MKEKSKSILKWVAMSTIAALVIIPLTFFILVYKGAFGKLYSEEELRNIQSYLATEVYSADNKTLGSFFWENRSNTDPKHIHPFLIKALVATEDARFYEHNGVDFKSLARVFFKTLLMGEKSSGGGSTLAQQLSKNLFKRQNHGIWTKPVNKIKEAIHAVRLTSVYNREELLILYLNTVSLGEDTYGIKNASNRFFNKPPDSLSIQESAVLVGMLKSPTYYNPRLHPDNALKRRNIVIQNLVIHQDLNQHEADSLIKLPLEIHYSHGGKYGELAPYFLQNIETLTKNIVDSLQGPNGKKYNIYTDGLKVYTTLDVKMQNYAMAAVKGYMSYLQTLLDRQLKGYDILKRYPTIVSNELKNSKRYKGLVAQKLSKSEINTFLKTPKETEIFDWKGGRKVNLSPLDSLKYCIQLLHTGILAMEPSTGAVKVWVGGNDYRFFQYDHILAKRQVGSTFKPIVYATALEQGMSPCEYIDNQKHVYPQYGGWSPSNADGQYGGKYSMAGALANSVNVVSVEVLLRAGIDRTITNANRMGIKSDLPHVPALALGVANISLLEMVNAYCVFPNGGKTIAPVLITKIEDRTGKVIYEAKQPKSKTVFSRQTAYYLTEMLKGVVNEGTGQRIRTAYKLSGAIAGKTGTTQSSSDGWFIGYTPGLVTGVWVGAENPAIHFTNGEYGQGAFMALPIWAMFVKQCKNKTEYRTYFNGDFKYGAGLTPMPQCESYKKDTFIDKIKNFFKRKDRTGEPKKKRGFLFWKKDR